MLKVNIEQMQTCSAAVPLGRLLNSHLVSRSRRSQTLTHSRRHRSEQRAQRSRLASSSLRHEVHVLREVSRSDLVDGPTEDLRRLRRQLTRVGGHSGRVVAAEQTQEIELKCNQDIPVRVQCNVRVYRVLEIFSVDVHRLLGLSRSFQSVAGEAAQQSASCTD